MCPSLSALSIDYASEASVYATLFAGVQEEARIHAQDLRALLQPRTVIHELVYSLNKWRVV